MRDKWTIWFCPTANSMNLTCLGSIWTFETNIHGWALLLFALVPSSCTDCRYWAPVAEVRPPAVEERGEGSEPGSSPPHPSDCHGAHEASPSMLGEEGCVGERLGAQHGVTLRVSNDNALASSQHTQCLPGESRESLLCRCWVAGTAWAQRHTEH